MAMKKEMKEKVIARFEESMSYEEIKQAYVEFVTEFRGDKAAVKFINSAFEKNVESVKDIHVNKKGETYQKAPTEAPKDFMGLIESLLGMDGVVVEVCGTWLWVSGDTKQHRDALKTCGFRWAAKKKMWFKAPEGTRHFKGKKTWDMSKIRDVYGSHVVESADEIA